MNAKQIIETLKNIQKHCDSKETCSGCVFDVNRIITGSRCQLAAIAEGLDKTPNYWDLEEIERLINE